MRVLKPIGFPQRRATALTLVEVLISMAIGSVLVGTIIYGYVDATRNVEWSSYSMAAQSMALQRVEQVRAAMWDPDGVPPKDEAVATNFPVLALQLDIPSKGTNIVWATNYTTIGWVSSNPPLKWVRVDCVWNFRRGNAYRWFTNTIVTYRRPNA